MGASRYHIEFILLWLLCTIMLNSVMCSSKVVQCKEKDMNALLKFKRGVSDPSGLLSSWFTGKDCCQWIGVGCDNITGRVTELNLPCHSIVPAYAIDKDDKSHCLTGKFDISLLDLEFLRHLNLSNNDFKTIKYSVPNQTCNDLSSGAPPRQCGNYSYNIHSLDLSYNFYLIIDNLHWISRLSSLQYLNLNGIDLHKETDWLQSMTMLPSLFELHLLSCKLQNIYPSLQFANFTALKVLDLSYNEFKSPLPRWLFNLSCGISEIYLNEGHIYGQLPETLPNLQSIESLCLPANNLDGPIPDWLGQLEQLQVLDLSDNSFSGPIPTSLGNLSSLITLDLSSNLFNGSLPGSLGQLFNLEYLDFGDNFLTGIVSERFFCSLSKLKNLGFGSPALIFDFDPQWIPTFQLQDLSLGYVGPQLPSWIYTQNSLKTLYIENSKTSFEPLGMFWKFAAQLDIFQVSNTSINADMSNVLLNSKFVKLNYNSLRGGVPQVSPNVTILNLHGNNLSGSIFPLLCHKMKVKSNLEYLDISSNILSGEIPNCWVNWKSLLHVDLGDNNLTGKIPHSMGSLSKLISLNLYGNKLSGKIPLSLKYCENLRILNLGENNFSGTISSWVGQRLNALQLRSNQFSGNVLAEICQLHSLKILDFSNNRLSGPIPNCLHNMTSMISEHGSIDNFMIIMQAFNVAYVFYLDLTLVIKGLKLTYSHSICTIDLSNNSLWGTMPLELFMLTGLQSLNLSHNQLMGMIPKNIGNLTQLEALDLSSNRLWGQIPQSMSGLSFLEVLNLSFNNFVGKIPSGTQLQGFTYLSYMGNPKLCGPPLTKICPQDEKPIDGKGMGEDDDGDDDDKSEVHSWFYMGLGIGFATGFWGVLGAIFFNRRCRHAYFKFLGRLYDMVIQKMNTIY